MVPRIANSNVWPTIGKKNTSYIVSRAFKLCQENELVSYYKFIFQMSCVAGYCYYLKTTCGTSILLLSDAMGNHYMEYVKVRAVSYLFHEKVMNQELCGCWKTSQQGCIDY